MIPCRSFAGLLAATVLVLACRRSGNSTNNDAGIAPSAQASVPQSLPQVLYLPDGGDQVIGSNPNSVPNAFVEFPSAALNPARRCPPEMVEVKGQFCIDRWESSLVDATSGRDLSPYYSPLPDHAKKARSYWQSEHLAMGSASARTLELPELADWQLNNHVEPMAVSKPGRVPNGYLDGNSAQRACERAGKRLCTTDEWTTACRGKQARSFPYGDRYEQGACNVFREAHPAVILHGDASIGHLDPRLNLVESPEGPLLRRTGATTRCASQWGQDAVYDMVGNLDEWVDDGAGAFLGGFYARATRSGCDARISTHPRAYADYSLGVRCCK